MLSDDYATSIRGSLKLKGSKPSGIEKKKKKKKPKPNSDPSSTTDEQTGSTSDTQKSALQHALEDEDEVDGAAKRRSARKVRDGEEGEGEGELEGDEEGNLRELEMRGGDGKTASERAYEEMRRKRLHDRLLKEGVKTHKQRVEELNKYLSNLSEHHDMPKIGPG